MFLRQSTVGREPLAVAMSGVRMGERLLQIGMDTPVVTSLLAARPGLSGESALVLLEDDAAVRARRAISETGALVDIRVQAPDALPFGAAAFDVIVVQNRHGGFDSHLQRGSRVLGECRRVLRSGGRILVIERGEASGLKAFFQPKADSSRTEATIGTLEAAGFRAVRLLGDRDGYRFVEGLNVE